MMSKAGFGTDCRKSGAVGSGRRSRIVGFGMGVLQRFDEPLGFAGLPCFGGSRGNSVKSGSCVAVLGGFGAGGFGSSTCGPDPKSLGAVAPLSYMGEEDRLRLAVGGSTVNSDA